MFTRKIFLLALMLLAVMAFTGCDNTPPRPPKPDSVIVEEEIIKIATPAGFVRVDGWFPTVDSKLNEMASKALGDPQINFLAIFCPDEKSLKKIAKTIYDDSVFLFGVPDQVEVVMLIEIPLINQVIQSANLDLNDEARRNEIFSGFAKTYEKRGGHTFGNVPNTVLGYAKIPAQDRKQGHGYLGVTSIMIIKKKCLLTISVLVSKEDDPANETKIKSTSEQWVKKMQEINN